MRNMIMLKGYETSKHEKENKRIKKNEIESWDGGNERIDSDRIMTL